jgi:hypothetical protein
MRNQQSSIGPDSDTNSQEGDMGGLTRRTYITAVTSLLEQVGYEVNEMSGGRLVARNKQQLLLIDPVGKKLPYQGKNGQECFEWETWIDPDRIDRLEVLARSIDADPWFAFCYALMHPRYEADFDALATIGGLNFGVRAISSASFRKSMVARSPSWAKVNLPREAVINLTFDITRL